MNIIYFLPRLDRKDYHILSIVLWFVSMVQVIFNTLAWTLFDVDFLLI